MAYPAEELERLRALTQLYYPEEYEPKAIFSPSGLEKWKRCARAGGYRYLLGIKRREVPWAVASALLEPTWKGKPTDEDREARKLYNSLVRPALGVEGHARMQGYYQGRDVEWNDRVGRIMLPGLGCIPHPDDCSVVEAEGEIEYRGIKFRGFRDLLVRDRHSGEWLLDDHKTTYTFDFIDREKTIKSVKTPEQLTADIQANLYAFAVMQDHDLEALDCRWVYYRTEGDAAALPVDFVIERAAAEAKMFALSEQAIALKDHYYSALACRQDGKVHLPQVREYVERLPANTGACDDFGGCEYSAERGGPCKAVAKPSEIARRARAKQQLRAAMPPAEKPRASAIVKAARRTNVMGFRDNLKNKQAAAGAAQGGASTEAPAEQVETQAEAPTEQAQTEAPATEAQAATPAEPPPAAAASTPKRNTRAASKAAAPAGGLAQLAAELAAKEAAAIEAQAAFDAAKAAMREALA